MSGEVLDFKKHLCLQIVQYCHVHEEETPRNGQAARTKGAILLGPSGNLQGGFKFMALNTGKKIMRHNWDVIPMPELVIARVTILRSDQPELLTFTDRHGRLIGDTDVSALHDDSALHDNSESVDADVELPGVDLAIDDHIEIPGVDNEEGPEGPTTQEIEIDDLDVQELNPPPFELEPAPNLHADTVHQAAPVQETVQMPELRRSTRARTQASQGYVPSLTGSRYSYAVTQLESHGVLNPDAHMFMQGNFY